MSDRKFTGDHIEAKMAGFATVENGDPRMWAAYAGGRPITFPTAKKGDADLVAAAFNISNQLEDAGYDAMAVLEGLREVISCLNVAANCHDFEVSEVCANLLTKVRR